MSLNETHDPQLESWLDASNHPDCEFPIQNLPFGVFTKAPDEPRGGVALGDQIIDVARLADLGLVQDSASVAARCCANPTLNALMSLGRPYWNALRCELSTLFSRASEAKREQLRECLVPMSAVQMQLPASIGDYSDFYTSIYHARNVGLLFRPDNPLLDNYYHLPIAYHGRSSSVIVSGEDVQRPIGQIRAGGEQGVTVSRSTKLDYEFELGAFIGPGNERGRPLALADAEEHVFGLCLLNDWSARDIQAFEYQPLGPFLGKSFATTISPWIVTLDALAPFRGPWQVGDSRFPLADYLRAPRNAQQGAFHIELEAYLHTETMRAQKEAPSRLSATKLSPCLLDNRSNGRASHYQRM